jgi:hypothetical protein
MDAKQEAAKGLELYPIRDQPTPGHAIIYARILCCEIVPVKAGAVEREAPAAVGHCLENSIGTGRDDGDQTAEAAICLTNFMG